jgi:hypothetical protein
MRELHNESHDLRKCRGLCCAFTYIAFVDTEHVFVVNTS